MGNIKKILENELMGGTQSTEVYPVTSTKAVYDENNKRLDEILSASDEKLIELEQEQIQGGIYDVSARNNGAVFESLSSLLSSSNLSTLIPISVRHGGMSIRFVQSSDNKYVQYRLMTQNFTTNVTQWQGVDDEPTVKSNNLVKSGGVAEKCFITRKYRRRYVNIKGIVTDTTVESFSVSDYIKIGDGLTLINAKPAQPTADSRLIVGAFYDASFNFISILTAQSIALQNVILTSDNVPSNAVFFIANLDSEKGYVLYPTLSNLNGFEEIKDLYARTVVDSEITSSSINPVKSSAIYAANQKLNNKILGAKIDLEQYKFIRLVNGIPEVVKTSVSTFSLTPYLYIDGLKHYDVIVLKPHGASPYEYAAIYDDNFTPIGYLHTNRPHGTVDYNLAQLETDIQSLGLQSTAKYVRFTCAYDKYPDGKIPVPPIQKVVDLTWWDNKDMFDYEKVLKMPKDVVKAMVETYSMGKITPLYDSDGYPSLMYKIPRMSIGQFSKDLGDLSTPHPAFIVNGATKDYVYISVFMTCEYNGHLVSWFGLLPSRSRNLNYLKSNIPQKGNGWHLETIYERSLLSLLTRAFNSPTPHCNNYWGMNRYAEHESVQMANSGLAGQGNQSNGAQWINGTQPVEWSHNKTSFGIQDVCGGYHEIVDLVKLVDGHIYLADDNNFGSADNTWADTGATIDCINDKTVISNTYTYSGEIKDDNFENVKCTVGFDSLSEDIRKKLVLLGISPRLSSEAAQALLGYKGDLQSKGSGTCYMVCGGAEEYSDCGLGYYNICYDLMTDRAHNNMGSRLCYIE